MGPSKATRLHIRLDSSSRGTLRPVSTGSINMFLLGCITELRKGMGQLEQSFAVLWIRFRQIADHDYSKTVRAEGGLCSQSQFIEK